MGKKRISGYGEVLYSGVANRKVQAYYERGQLFLLSDGLYYQSHSKNIQGKAISILFSDIEHIDFFKARGFVSGGLEVVLSNDKTEYFAMRHYKEWKQLIEQAVAAQKSKRETPEFLAFERAALEAIIYSDPRLTSDGTIDTLLHQVKAAKVGKRYFTVSSFWTNYYYECDVPCLTDIYEGIFGGLNAFVPSVPNGIGLGLTISEGRIMQLEGYTYLGLAEPWPDDLTQFEFMDSDALSKRIGLR